MPAKAMKARPATRGSKAPQAGEAPATKLLTVPEAGRIFFGLSRNGAYEAARRGELPVVRIGRKVWVSVPAIERMIAEAGAKHPGNAT